jgi:hypothetical protein
VQPSLDHVPHMYLWAEAVTLPFWDIRGNANLSGKNI